MADNTNDRFDTLLEAMLTKPGPDSLEGIHAPFGL